MSASLAALAAGLLGTLPGWVDGEDLRAPAGDRVRYELEESSVPSERWSARKLEIWDQLGVLLLREGFRDLTVGDLAEQLSCSRRTLYSLATSRDELIVGVVEHLFAARAEAAAAAVAGAPDIPGAIVAHVTNGVMAFDATPAFLADVVGRPATNRVFHAYRRTWRAALVALITKGMAAKEVRRCDKDLVADLLDAVAERLAERRHRTVRRLSAADATTTVDGLVRGWLTP